MSTQHPKELLHLLATAARDLTVFRPQVEHRKAKSNFWSRYADGTVPLPQNVDLSLALKFAGDRRIKEWWEIPGFHDWFTNQEEYKQRVEYLTHLALDAFEVVLADRNAPPSAKIAAAKLILEVGDRFPRKSGSDKFIDEKVAEMTPAQLEEFIRRQMPKLVGPAED